MEERTEPEHRLDTRSGNEIADILAKSAAQEAETMEEEDRVVTAADIKTAVKVSCEKK